MIDVLLTPEAQEQFDALPPIIKERVRKLFRRLKGWPNVSGAKPLAGNLVGWYRMRTGDYRIRFRLKGEKVIVAKIGHRKGIYDD